MRRTALALTVALVAVVVPVAVGTAPAGADASFTVTSTADQVVSIRFTTLREAVEAAATATGTATISLQAGLTYNLSLCTGGTEDANARGDLDVRGTATRVVIDGNGATINQTCAGERVVDHLAGPALTLREVTVTGGDAVGDGGGVRSTGSLRVEKATISDNVATGDGGGVRADSLSMLSVDVRGNEAGGDGGGMLATQPGIPPAVITLDQVEMSANTAGGVGGGAVLGGLVTIRRSAVVDNAAASTGGLVLPLGTLENTTVADNDETGAASPADGVEVHSTTNLILRHATVRGGTGAGGAVTATGVFQATASAVAAGVTGAACGAGDESGGGGANADDDDTCGFDAVDDHTGSPLGLTATLTGTIPLIRPAGSSVLVDADADCGAALTVDQRGTARPQGSGCDGGAVEAVRRADALIRRSTVTGFAGNNVYAPNVGLAQIIGATTPRAVATTVVVRLQNDGEVRERQIVQGPASDNRMTVRYAAGGVDVTAAVVAGTFLTSALAPGASQDLTVRITPRASAPVGSGRQVTVKTRLQSQATATDAVAVLVTVGS